MSAPTLYNEVWPKLNYRSWISKFKNYNFISSDEICFRKDNGENVGLIMSDIKGCMLNLGIL